MPELTTHDLLFHILGGLSVLAAVLVVFLSNPVYCALFLALCMSMLGIMFFTLEAYFVAAAQITVYAGAVMVLFVMVLMLFDLKKEHEDLFRVSPLGVTKIVVTGLLCGFLIGAGWMAAQYVHQSPVVELAPEVSVQEMQKGELEAKPNAQTLLEFEEEEDLFIDPKVVVTEEAPQPNIGSTTYLSQTLFSKWIIAFEAVGLVILLVTVGAVALAKSKGGTHHA